MADEQTFDTEQARARRNAILDPLNTVLTDLKDSVVDYYWNKIPQNQDEENKMRTFIRERLERASRVVETLRQTL
jgi:hypothetical protein